MDKELDNPPGPGLPKAETVSARGILLPAAVPAHDALAIGLDIESADNLPPPGGPWSEPFYVENFTRTEMAWCLHRPDPRPNHA
jgi:hypothetical protein